MQRTQPHEAPFVERTVRVQINSIELEGNLVVPDGVSGVVLFAHGSGSGRHSPRNRFVAQHLQQGGIGTLLIDLLTREEEEDRRNVFDIDLLADRVLMASAWLREHTGTNRLPLGYFGASTGAGAALQAAARASFRIGAIVSRGGRPDLAERFLPEVTAPTLLLVGDEDFTALIDRHEHLSEEMPNAFAAVLEGVAHIPSIERPELVNSMLLEFLDAIAGGDGEESDDESAD